jgi:hypothetical protein
MQPRIDDVTLIPVLTGQSARDSYNELQLGQAREFVAASVLKQIVCLSQPP